MYWSWSWWKFWSNLSIAVFGAFWLAAGYWLSGPTAESHRSPAQTLKKRASAMTYELQALEGEIPDELAYSCKVPVSLESRATSDGATLARHLVPQVAASLLSSLEMQASDVNFTLHEHWTNDLYDDQSETPERHRNVRMIFGVHDKETNTRFANVEVALPTAEQTAPSQINVKLKASGLECPEFNYKPRM